MLMFSVKFGGKLSPSSWPGLVVQRTASLPLAYGPAIYVFIGFGAKNVDPRDKSWHDEF
jgi:hypothetical protein